MLSLITKIKLEKMDYETMFSTQILFNAGFNVVASPASGGGED
jgi:hypothetical protein